MRQNFKALLVSGLIGLSSLAMFSCTSMITPEQLQEIRELRQRQAQLEETIRKREADLAGLQTEVKARQRELDKCQEVKAFIEEKLANWPNVWPD